MIDPAAVGAEVARVRERMAAAGGDPERITLVAVVKGFGPDAVDAAMVAGVADIGERTAQDLRAKVTALTGPVPRWHFIGRLQSNKIRLVADEVALWQSVDRPALVDELARRAPGARLLVQVNVSGEPQKGGCDPAAAGALVKRATDAGLDVAGLMAVGPTGPPEAARPGFRALSSLADRLHLPVRSMGMTADLEVAVQEGSTMVRIGRALFGPRAN